MFISGIGRIYDIITEEQRLHIKNIILKKEANNELFLENDPLTEINTYALGNIDEIDEYYKQLTPILENFTGLKLEKANSYSRIYKEGGTLKKHIDREGLEITLSLQIENSTGISQPVFAEDYNNRLFETHLNDRDGLVIKGRDLTHWRNRIKTTNEKGALINVFFHWSIVKGEVLEIELLDRELCDKIINESESKGFDKSSVLQNGVNVENHYSRSSSTCWFNDTFGITDKIREKVWAIGNLKLEGWQLVRYNVGEEFKAHFDALNKENDRLFTTIIYLNDNFEGGETEFPTTGDLIRPEQGKLVIWKNLIAGKNNPKSLHSGNPVLKGTKYVLVSWFLQP